MIGPMSRAQRAQQNNRDAGGRYAEQHLADPGTQVLADSSELIRNITTSTDPLPVQLARNAAAAVLRDEDGTIEARLADMAVSQAEQSTILVSDSNLHSLYLVEGRVAEVENGTVAMWPKGLRARGFRFPLGAVCAVRDGYGRSDDVLHDLTRIATTVVPPLEDDLMLEWLPPYDADRHDIDTAPVAACYLLRHRESPTEQATHGCVVAAVAADDDYVYGHLWAPANSGIRSRFVRASRLRVAAMSARIANYQPGSVAVADCEHLPSGRAEMYDLIACGNRQTA